MNATDLLNLRQAGKRPHGPVLATLVPEVNRYHPAISIHRADDYAGFFDLDVFVAFHTSQIESAIHVADALIRAHACSITLWGLDTGRLVSVVDGGIKHITPTLPGPAMVELVRKIQCR